MTRSRPNIHKIFRVYISHEEGQLEILSFCHKLYNTGVIFFYFCLYLAVILIVLGPLEMCLRLINVLYKDAE